MSRLESVQSSHLHFHTLKSFESQEAISSLLHLVSSCAGPDGKNQVIRNSCGGHMTITSTSLRLLSAMMISRNEIKFIVSAVLVHVKQCGDSGLFMAFMILTLIKSYMPMDIPHFISTSLFHTFISAINSYLSSDLCEMVLKVDFSNVRVLLAYAKSVLTSKTLLNLQPNDCDTLSHLVVETFVGAVPTVPGKRYSNGIYLVSLENQPVSSSKVLEGMLLACPEISSFGDIVEPDLIKQLVSNSQTSYIKVALLTCSMSGDVEEMVQASFEATEQQFCEVDKAVMLKMMALCSCLEEEEVGVVLCQKVIHPNIKAALKSRNIFFLDRLGSQVIPYLRDVTGCVPMSSVMLPKSQLLDCLGRLTSVSHHIEGGKDYLLLDNVDASVNSLVVCGEWEERVSELKSCVYSCIQGLFLLTKDPKLLMGGGCWQMNCSVMLEKQFMNDIPKMTYGFSCSEFELWQTLSWFIAALRGWCLQLKSKKDHLSYELSSGHTWLVSKGITATTQSNEELQRCCCGFKALPSNCLQDLDIVLDCGLSSPSLVGKSKYESHVIEIQDLDGCVLDSFTTSVQALNKATLTASTLTSIGHFITDRN